MTNQNRIRGRYLTDQAYNKIWKAIYEQFPSNGESKEKLLLDLEHFTDPQKNSKAGKKITTDTISKIINRTEKTDIASIKALFQAFALPFNKNEDTRIEPPIIDDPEYDPNFVGREDAIARLNQLIYKNSGTGILPVSPVTRICQIVAPGGQGKTTLARKYLENRFKKVLKFNIAQERKNIASVESWVEENLRELGEEPGREFMISLKRLEQKLKTEEIGILIDNLEPALDGSGRFIEQHRSYVELLRVLSDSSLQSLTLITSRERLNEGLNITLYSLPSLTESVWGEFWQYQGINPDITLLTEIHKAYGGNALAMKVLSNLINNDYQGDIVAYW